MIVGCGYLGHRVARRWLAAGDLVYAVTRRAERAAAWQGEGIRPIVADVTRPETLAGLPAVDSVLYAVGHDATSGQTHQASYAGGLRNVLGALSPNFRRLIYISSTGVYGDRRGDWVDEETPCEPQRAAGQACLAAERMLEEHRLAQRAVILRLAGLYGPDRIPRQTALLAGDPIDAPQHGFLNLIHVDDAVEAVLAAASADLQLPRRFLVSDGAPVERSEYYAELARLVGAPPPRFRAPDGETPAHARAGADKRISNARMLAELKVVPRFPSYREGLKAIVEAAK
ncbi:MAG TPA: SDR family oxidoreductase [Pirellulales bacterium]|nr:SDR family oxidoreductase [Pirellulales bacterium]